MSKVFDAYAAYYDLLYAGKDYAGEAAWIDSLIRRYRPDGSSILEMGCGTGGHALQLARRGYMVTGLDLSPSMVSRANDNAKRAMLGALQPEFRTGDLRVYRAKRSFDVVVALFHVMSYQVTNEDLQAAMATAAAHLSPGGLFIFDCWYGPGVLTDLPTTRVRRMSGDGFSITRIAEPEHRPDENRVNVHYEILVERGVVMDRIRECHSMRYLFTPEVDLLLTGAGLERIAAIRWLGESTPGTEDWNACYVTRPVT